MKIVKATKKNINEIVNIEMNSGYHDNPVESDLRKLFSDFFNLKNIYAYILKEDNKIIGYFAFSSVGNNYGGGYIAVIKEYQGKGYGKLLLNKLILLCKKLKFKDITISVRKSNDKAIGLYKKYDFEIIGEKGIKLIMKKELK